MVSSGLPTSHAIPSPSSHTEHAQGSSLSHETQQQMSTHRPVLTDVLTLQWASSLGPQAGTRRAAQNRMKTHRDRGPGCLSGHPGAWGSLNRGQGASGWASPPVTWGAHPASSSSASPPRPPQELPGPLPGPRGGRGSSACPPHIPGLQSYLHPFASLLPLHLWARSSLRWVPRGTDSPRDVGGLGSLEVSEQEVPTQAAGLSPPTGDLCWLRRLPRC